MFIFKKSKNLKRKVLHLQTPTLVNKPTEEKEVVEDVNSVNIEETEPVAKKTTRKKAENKKEEKANENE